MLIAPFCSRGFGLWVKRVVLNTEPNRVFGALGIYLFKIATNKFNIESFKVDF